jgi:hypothetical protein
MLLQLLLLLLAELLSLLLGLQLLLVLLLGQDRDREMSFLFATQASLQCFCRSRLFALAGCLLPFTWMGKVFLLKKLKHL